MKKRFTKIMLLLFALVVGISSAWAQTSYTYKLVTNANQLSDGDKIIIASGKTAGSCTAIGAANGSSNRKAVSATVAGTGAAVTITTEIDNGNETTSGANTANNDLTKPLEITLVSSSTNWNLKEVVKNDGVVYLNGGSKSKSGNNNHLKAGASVITTTGQNNANGVWSIDVNTTSYIATITNQNNFKIQKNSSSAIFASYSSAQNDVYIYKKAYTVSYNANGGTGTMTDSNSPYFMNSTVTTQTNTFTNGGQTFTGWNTKANGSGTPYAEGATFSITENTTLYAQWASATTVVTPSIYLDGGTYTGDQSTTISCSTAGASIYYTLDGTDPSSTNGTLYSGAITIDHSCTLKAVGIKDGLTNSEIASATYTIKVNTPSFTPTGGNLYQTTSVAINCETAGASIYYTMGADPADPTSSSTPYTGAISVSSATKIKAIAIKDGLTNSEVATATFTFPTVKTIAEARAYTGDDNFYTRGVVTFKDSDGKTAYIQDATAAIAIYKNETNFTSGLTVGDEIVVKGKKSTYHGLVEVGSASIEATLSTSNVVSPTVKTMAAINTDYGSGSGDNNFQSMYVKIEKATYNGSTSVSQGNNTIPVSGTMGSAVNGDAVTFTGIIGCYDAVKIINIGNVQIVNDPTIIAASSIAAPNYIKNTSAVNIVTKNLAVTGANLESDITATLEDGDESAFEIKVGEGSWGKTATLTESEGSVNTNITVRLKAGQNVADYSDKIILESTNATTVNVNITGSVTYANVTYNGNATGVTNVPTDATDYTYNQSVTVAGVGTMTNTGHTFTGWNSKSDGSGSAFGASFNITQDTTLYAQWTVNTHTLTLPGTDAYGTYTADKSSPVAYGTKVTLTYTPEEGYENYLAQWSSSNVSIASDGTFTMPDNDVTVKVDVIPNPYIKDIVNRALTGVTSGSTSYSGWSNKSSNSDAKYAGNSAGGNDAIQLRTSSNAGIVTTTSGGKVRKVVIVWNTETAATRVLDVYGNNSAYSGVSDLFSAQSSTQGTLLGSATYKKKGDAQTDVIYIANDYAYIGIRSNSGALYIDEIQIFWEYVLPTAAGALTKNATIAENLIVHETNLTIPAAYMLTIEGTLIVSGTLTNSGDENNIYIADGGQLYANSVVATVAKDIEDANSKDAGDHWYTISSPVNDGENTSIPVTDVQYLISGPVGFAYDMFSYDEKNMLWLNQKKIGDVAGFSEMNVGQGYLYRNSGQTLEFPGETNTGNISYTLSKKSEGKLSGFNLMGNPYPHDITLNHITYSTGENLSGCLVLSDQGSWETKLGVTGKIHSSQGFLVQSDVDGKVATIHEEAQRSRSNNDYIKFVVSNSQYEDVTFTLFDKGYGLNKINHRNSEIPMLYIYQNDNKYAIATMDDDTKSFNLNFKAMTMGMYTLSYEATGEFSYLHIIDRLTGTDVDMLTEGEYKFVGTSTDSENRFIVRLVYSSDNEEINNDIFAYQSGNDIVVNGSGELQIFDVTGRMVSTKRVNGVETINVPSQGVYIFRLLGTEVQTQKIVVR